MRTVDYLRGTSWNKNRKQNRHGSRNADRSHLVFMMIAAVVLLYIGRSFFGIFSAAPETTPAMRVTVNDSFTADGWFVRDEITIEGRR